MALKNPFVLVRSLPYIYETFSNPQNQRSTIKNKVNSKCYFCGQHFSTFSRFQEHVNKHTLEAPFKCNWCTESLISSDKLSIHLKKCDEMTKGKDKFRCIICNKMFLRKGNLKTHLLSHKYPKHGCKFCSKKFANRAELLEHTKVCEKRPKRKAKNRELYKCYFCASVVTWNVLRIHINKHNLQKPFKCLLCKDMAYVSSFHLSRHTLYAHRRERLKCKYCHRIFLRKKNLVLHQNLHEKSPTEQCKNCHEKFHTKYQLKHHVVHEHAEPVSCPHCHKILQSKRYLEFHIKTVHEKSDEYKCTFCKMGFVNFYRLNRHMRKIHLGEDDKKEFPCGLDSCLLTFNTKGKLHHHQIKYHKHKGLTWECPKCSKTWPHQGAYRAHMRIYHPKQKRIPEKLCRICGKSFFVQSELEYHTRRIHTGEKPFKCAVPGCGKSFSVGSELNLHKKRHNMKEPGTREKCQFCKNSYLNLKQLKIHVRTQHKGIRKTFKCYFCAKVMLNPESFMNHVNTHTGERPWKCGYKGCKAEFVSRETMLRHLVKVHGFKKAPRDLPNDMRKCKCYFCPKVLTLRSIKSHINSHTGEKTMRCQQCQETFMTEHILRAHSKLHGKVKNV